MENINNPDGTPKLSALDQFKKLGEKGDALPGSFHSESEVERKEESALSIPTINSKQFEAISHPDLVADYKLFQEKLHPKTDVVYYPCMANDISPSVAFPNSKVIYVDLDKDCVEGIQRAGLEAHTASALEFDPGQVDVLIMMNPQIQPDVPASYLVEGGFILCNNWHSTASSMHKKNDFKLCGVIRHDSDKEPWLDTEKLDDYWKETETEEDLQNVPGFYGNATSIVETITGKKENIFAEYKKIIEMAKEQMREKNAKLVAQNPAYKDLLPDPDRSGMLNLEYMGQPLYIPDFPYKKSGNIYVFQKDTV